MITRVPPGTWETLSFPSSQAAGDTAHQLQIDPRLRVRNRSGGMGGAWGQTEFQVNLKLGLTPRRRRPRGGGKGDSHQIDKARISW